jgi:DNA-binding beta-propeller fold protein YncE
VGINGDTVTPIRTATNTPGRPIRVGSFPVAIAITPDSKTAYVANSAGPSPRSRPLPTLLARRSLSAAVPMPSRSPRTG